MTFHWQQLFLIPGALVAVGFVRVWHEVRKARKHPK